MNRDALRRLSDSDILALTLYGEARGESRDGKLAVACVIRNRMRERRQTAREVCWAPLQFSCWTPCGGTQNHAVVVALAEQLAANPAEPCPQGFCECLEIASEVLRDLAGDVTGGANHYLTASLFASKAAPRWARTMRETARIGKHVFLTDRGEQAA